MKIGDRVSVRVTRARRLVTGRISFVDLPRSRCAVILDGTGRAVVRDLRRVRSFMSR